MITILQNDTQIEFLSNLQDIRFRATTGKAQVTITSRSSGAVVYDETLSSTGTDFTLYDIPGLLDPYVYMMGPNESFNVHIEETDGSEADFVMRVVACKAEVGSFAEFANSHFLSLHNDNVRTAPGRREMIALWKYAASGTIEVPTATVRAYFTDGTHQDTALALSDGGGVGIKIDPVGALTDSAHYYYCTLDIDDYVVEGKELYRMVVTCEGRTKEYVIDAYHDNPDPVILFSNSFNETELFYCTGKVESAPEYERTNVIINRQMQTARVRETRYWNADTGILRAGEEEWLLEMMRSNHVFVCRKNDEGKWAWWKRIVITEQECLYTNEDDNLPRYTFKYRLAQGNQIVPEMRIHPEIFTQTYTPTYE